MIRGLVAVAALLLALTAVPGESAAQSGKKKGGSPPPPTSSEGLIQLATADDVIAALRAEGASNLESTVDSYGDPQVNGSYEDLNFSVRFYKCEPGLACSQVQFRISFASDTDSYETDILMRDWNREWVFGKAYSNSAGSMILEHPIYLAGGMSREMLEINAELWLEIMVDFAEHIGWN